VLPDGTLDATFGTEGIATAEVLGPKPAAAEGLRHRAPMASFVMTRLRHQDRRPVDLVAFRFTADGT